MGDAGSYAVVVTNAFGPVTSTSATLAVLSGTPVVTWPSPAPITYGAALGNLQLDATADMPGTFTYTPPAGSVLSAGKANGGRVSPPITTGWAAWASRDTAGWQPAPPLRAIRSAPSALRPDEPETAASAVDL